MIRGAMLRFAALLRADGATPQQRSRLRVWAAVVAFVLIGQAAWIFLLRGHRILERDNVLVMGQLLIGMGLIGIAGLISTAPADAIRLNAATSRRLILAATAVLQLLAVWMLWPALSDELPRYRIEGLTWLSGRSPYVTRPMALRGNRHLDTVDRLASRRGSPSIYPPVAQTVFIGARAIELATVGPSSFEPRTDHPVRRWRDALPLLTTAKRALVLRVFAACAAVACVVVLLRILNDRGLSPWLAVLLAWNPLLLIEAGGNGHIDVLGILLVLLMFRMLQNGRAALATLALCLACGIKPTAILLAPLLVRQVWLMRNWQAAQRSIGIVIVTLAIVYLPILSVQSGLSGWLSAMQFYVQSEQGNGAVFVLLGQTSAARMLPPVVAMAVLLWVLRRRITVEDAAYWLMLTTLLASPRAMPQMVLWPLCLVPLLRHSFGWAGLAWSATAAFAYVSWHTPGGVLPGRILAAEYLPVLLAMGIQLKESLTWQPTPIPADAAASA